MGPLSRPAQKACLGRGNGSILHRAMKNPDFGTRSISKFSLHQPSQRGRFSQTENKTARLKSLFVFAMDRKPESTGKRIHRIRRFELIRIVNDGCRLLVHVG
jgi:hypothetical protein